MLARCAFFSMSVIATLIALAICQTAQQLNCAKQLMKTDNCIAHALLQNDEMRMPRTEAEVDEQLCKRLRSEIKCISGYRPCTRGIARLVYNQMTRNLVKYLIKEHCDKIEGRTQMVHFFKCFDDEHVELFQNVANKITIALDTISRTVPKSEQIGAMCCAYHQGMAYGRQYIDGYCHDRTGPDGSKFAIDLIGVTMRDTIELGCGGFSTLETCQQKAPDVVSMIKNITSLKMVQFPGHTPIVPALAVLQGLDTA